VAPGVGQGEQMVDEVDGVEPKVVADARRLGDGRPPIVGLAQQRAKADATVGSHRRSQYVPGRICLYSSLSLSTLKPAAWQVEMIFLSSASTLAMAAGI